MACRKGSIGQKAVGQAGADSSWGALGTLVRVSCDAAGQRLSFVGSDESADGQVEFSRSYLCNSCLSHLSKKTKTKINAACVAHNGHNQNMKICNR